MDEWMDDYILLIMSFLFLCTVSFSSGTVPSTCKYNIIYMYYVNHTHKIHVHVKTIDLLMLLDAVLYGL